MGEYTYFGVFDFDGWKAAKADEEVTKHLQCGYYAAWINPDGRIHAVNYHEAFNSDNPTQRRGYTAYEVNYGNGYARWYGGPKGEFGLITSKPLTKAQADVAIKLLYHLDCRESFIVLKSDKSGKEDSGIHSDKTDTVTHIRRLVQAA